MGVAIWILKVWLAMYLWDFLVTAFAVVKELRKPIEPNGPCFYTDHGGKA